MVICLPAQYNCNNCGKEVKSTDSYCPTCGKKLSEVGRAIKLEIMETLSLSQPKEVSNALSSSFTVFSSGLQTTGSLINAIPPERRANYGISEGFVKDFNNLQTEVQKLRKQTPIIDLRGSTINAPLYIAQGDNIVLNVNMEDSFKRLTQEIEELNSAPSLKEAAKIKAGELKAEINKKKPDPSKASRIYNELKETIPAGAAIIEIGVFLAKIFFGVGP
jgi:hypothetical protein